MEITKVVIKSGSGYGPISEAYEDKLTITESSISYEYIPHPMSQSKNNVYRKWAYKTTSPIFKQLFKEVVTKTPYYLYNTDKLFVTDIGPTEIIVSFEDKHKEKALFFCPSEFFFDYFTLIKKMIPATEYTPAVLLTSDDFEDD